MTMSDETVPLVHTAAFRRSVADNRSYCILENEFQGKLSSEGNKRK
jgi:hypothetical protein